MEVHEESQDKPLPFTQEGSALRWKLGFVLGLLVLSLKLARLVIWRPLVWCWRQRGRILLSMGVVAALVAALVVIMHAAVLEPERELRGSDAVFFDMTAFLFSTTRGDEVVQSALTQIIHEESPNSWSVSNICRWSAEHPDAGLGPRCAELARDTER